METKIEHNKNFWAASLGNDKLRCRVAACFLQQLAYCTYNTNAAASSIQTRKGAAAAPATSSNQEPFEISSPLKKPATTTNTKTNFTTTATTSSSTSTSTSSAIASIWKATNNGTSFSALHLPPPRLVLRKGGSSQHQHQHQHQQSFDEGSTKSNSPIQTQNPHQHFGGGGGGGGGGSGDKPTIPHVASANNAGLLGGGGGAGGGVAAGVGGVGVFGGSNSHITPRTTTKQPGDHGSLQTPRNEDFLASTATGKQWRSLLLLSERVFGHAISSKLPIQNRGASASRAVALGETWSAFLDANGFVRLCGSGAQGLNCRSGHRFVSIAWVGDFIAMIDERKDLYVARVSGSSSGLRSGHVLPAFVAPEGNPQKLMENVAEVSGTAAGLLVLNCAGEVFFYSVQKPRQAPLGGIVPYRSSSTVLLSPQLDIFVLDSLTKMLQKCTIQQHHGRPNTPRAVVSLRTQIKAMAAGHRFVICIDSNGGLWGMGWNEVGQLGLPGTDHVRAFQIHEQMSKTAFLTDVACGKRHSCVLSIDGVVYVAGSNKHGQIGITVPTTPPPANAVTTAKPQTKEQLQRDQQNDPGFPVARRFFRVPLREKCVAIACGPNASMFCLESFRVLVCGNNEFGQLGLDACLSVNPGQVPVCVASHGLFGVEQVAEYVKFTDPLYVCSTSSQQFDPLLTSGTASVASTSASAAASKGRRRVGGSTAGGGGCCGGGDESQSTMAMTTSVEPISGADSQHPGGGSSSSNHERSKSNDGCSCVIQ